MSAPLAKRLLLIFPACEEDDIIGDLIRSVPHGAVDAICLVDDGSQDRTAEEAELAGAIVIRHGERKGVGAAIRTGIDYALVNQFDIVVVMAANGKDDPTQLSVVTSPVLDGTADYVQGSRYISGGTRGNMPLYRRVATRAYPFVMSMLFRRKLTECTNGFRCYTLDFCRDTRLNLNQSWLNGYELELYLHYQALRLDYRYLEVPVSKIYPVRPGKPYTKITAVTGWWSMIRPVILLSLGIRR